MDYVTYHREDGTQTVEDDPEYEETGFTVTETGTTYTAELGQFYGKGAVFKLIATKRYDEFGRDAFIKSFVAAITSI